VCSSDLQFLWKTIGLIPANGSVLTQNGIPQISGREHVQIDTLYNPGIPYNFILADSQVTTFSDIATITPFLNSALTNESFGALSEGYGAILLQRGYSGPALFVPLDTNFTATTLTPYGGTSIVGSTFTRSTAGFSMWYGPYDTLYPGNYTATYVLSTNTTAVGSQALLTLDIVSNGGSTLYNSLTLNESAFAEANRPTTFTVGFQLSQVVTGMQFRGMNATGSANLTMYGVTIEQQSYY
jgi:hypothetical protein